MWGGGCIFRFVGCCCCFFGGEAFIVSFKKAHAVFKLRAYTMAAAVILIFVKQAKTECKVKLFHSFFLNYLHAHAFNGKCNIYIYFLNKN